MILLDDHNLLCYILLVHLSKQVFCEKKQHFFYTQSLFRQT